MFKKARPAIPHLIQKIHFSLKNVLFLNSSTLIFFSSLAYYLTNYFCVEESGIEKDVNIKCEEGENLRSVTNVKVYFLFFFSQNKNRVG